MRICFVGPANSAHIIKWCKWFVSRNHEVHVITFSLGEIENVTVHLINVNVDVNGSDLAKIRYLFLGKRFKDTINEIHPDIVSVHYATSYGIAMALSGFKGYSLSVWGSDIYEFPQKSIFHRALLEYSLRKAGILFSTSCSMANEASKYTKRCFEITPFGVDMDLFNPDKRIRYSEKKFIVGIVKSLSDLYGIEYLIRAISIFHTKNSEVKIELRIVGDGPREDYYKTLVKELKIEDITVFLGRVSQDIAAIEWANMDVAVIPSIKYESYGVSVVEAQASGTPVVISDVEGLIETTNNGKTSIVVAKKSAESIADAIERLYFDQNLRRKMGIEGRKNVVEKYELNLCFEKIENVFIKMHKCH